MKALILAQVLLHYIEAIAGGLAIKVATAVIINLLPLQLNTFDVGDGGEEEMGRGKK